MVNGVTQKLGKVIRLPDQFCGLCTLREGAATLIILLQLCNVAILTVPLLLMYVFPTVIDKWVKERVQSEVHTFFVLKLGHENVTRETFGLDYIQAWPVLGWSSVGICVGYIFLAFGVLYSVFKKTVHPLWYFPWLIVTVLLMLFSVGSVILTWVVLVPSFKNAKITHHMTPVVIFGCYVLFWLYVFIMVLAHCRKIFRERKMDGAADRTRTMIKKMAKERDAAHEEQTQVKVVKTRTAQHK